MKSGNPTISEKILYYIGYILPKEGGRFSYDKMQKFLNEYYGVEGSIRTLRKEFSLLKSKKYFLYKTYYRRPVPVLSADGRLAIAPVLKGRKYGPWDGKWRIAICSVPEKDRKYKNLFLQKLEELKFEKIFKGVYISPHPLLATVVRYANELGIAPKCIFFEAEKIAREVKTIQRIWDLDGVNVDYKEFIRHARRKYEQKGDHWVLEAKKIEKIFVEIFDKDPHLPEEFLPKGWKGKEAYELFKEISNSYNRRAR